MITRRNALLGLAIASASAATPLAALAQARTSEALPVLEVWKDPNCGCCHDWISYLEKEGFKVKAHDTGNTAMRRRLGLPMKYASCHTAVIGGYVVEGHVNAREIRRILKEKPDALGLSVPGMPIGSPGMDGPAYDGRKDPYDVVMVLKDGTSRVYQLYNR